MRGALQQADREIDGTKSHAVGLPALKFSPISLITTAAEACRMAPTASKHTKKYFEICFMEELLRARVEQQIAS